MKKIISLLLLISVLTAALCACGSAGDEGDAINAPDAFIQADAEHVLSLNVTSGTVPKEINTPAYAAGFAAAYNAATEFLPYGIDMNTDRAFVFTTSNGDNTSIFLVSRVAEGMFNVSVSGDAADGVNYKFRIRNSELDSFINDELMTIKNIDVTCHVKFVLGAETPAEDGTLRSSDETLFECDVTQNAPENDLPAALSAVTLALSENGAPDHTINKNSGFPSEIAGLSEVVTEKDGKTMRYYWKYLIDDTALETGGAAVDPVTDGCTVSVVYTASEIGA